jgi:hypothetical protein
MNERCSKSVKNESKIEKHLEPASISMSRKPLPENADQSICLTDAGMTIPFRDEQSENAFESMRTTPEIRSNTTELIQVHFQNAFAHIRSTCRGILTLELRPEYVIKHVRDESNKNSPSITNDGHPPSM